MEFSRGFAERIHGCRGRVFQKTWIQNGHRRRLRSSGFLGFALFGKLRATRAWPHAPRVSTPFIEEGGIGEMAHRVMPFDGCKRNLRATPARFL